MCYGKFKGKKLPDVPTNYLVWCVENDVFAGRDLQQVRDDLGRRLGISGGPDPGLAGKFNDLLADAIKLDHRAKAAEQKVASLGGVVRTWYRKAALACHPDRGGSHDVMILVNEIRDGVRDITGGL